MTHTKNHCRMESPTVVFHNLKIIERMKMKVWLRAVLLMCPFFLACSSSDDGPEPSPTGEMPITNLSMPSQSSLYSSGQTVSIGGYGFVQGAVISFRSVADTGSYVNALNVRPTDYNVSFVTPKVYGGQNVYLSQNSGQWLLGQMNFELPPFVPVDPATLTSISQYPPAEWDGVKRAGVFYEIFVRSFADSDGDGIGDLRGVADKLDYLDDLGVAGIWLTPINPSPSYHGYDVTDYEAVNPEFGTMADFEALVEKAHSLGIKVILDFVINHTSKTHPWFTDACGSENSPYRDYFLFSKNPQQDIAAGRIPMTRTYDAGQWHAVGEGTTDYKYMAMFSDWMPEINYGNVDECERSDAFKTICDAGRFWLAKGVDGFRLDAVKHIYQDENSDENPTFLRKFYTELAKTKPDLYMVGEALSEHNTVARYYEGLPAMFDFSSWYRLMYAIQNSHAKWFPKDMLNYADEYAAHRADYIDATKLSNHDEDRTRSVLGGGATVSLERAKMAAAVLLTSVGSPYVYYGEEIGMLGMKTNGDENVRDPMLWAPEAEDAYRTTWRRSSYSTEKAVGTVAGQAGEVNSIYNIYRFFLRLRNTYPALATGTMHLPENFADGDNSDKNFMVFYREAPGQRLLVIHNVSNTVATYPLHRAIKQPVADTKATGLEKLGDAEYRIHMPPYSSIIIEVD